MGSMVSVQFHGNVGKRPFFRRTSVDFLSSCVHQLMFSGLVFSYGFRSMGTFVKCSWCWISLDVLSGGPDDSGGLRERFLAGIISSSLQLVLPVSLREGRFHFQFIPSDLSTAPSWVYKDVAADGLLCRSPWSAEWSSFLDVFLEVRGSTAVFRGGPLCPSGGLDDFNLRILATILNPDFARSPFFKDLAKE